MTEQFERFKAEVLDADQESTLPRKLSDQWLEVLLKGISKFEANNDEAHHHSELYHCIKKILHLKNNGQNTTLAPQEFEMLVEMFKVELVMEKLARQGKYEFRPPATIETIFTDRHVEGRVPPKH